MEILRDNDEVAIAIAPHEASLLRDLAAREFNRKIKRSRPKAVRASSWAMELSAEQTTLEALGEALDQVFGDPGTPKAIE